MLIELQYFYQALGPVMKSLPRDQTLDVSKMSILNKITRLAVDTTSANFHELNSWCSSTGGSHASYRADVVSNLKSLEIIESTRLNTASFKA